MINIISNFYNKSNVLIILIIGLFLTINQGFTKQLRQLEEMALEEKIGQLFVISACELRGEEHRRDLYHLIHEAGIGGVLFKAGTVQGQRLFVSELQQMAKVPLLCVQDGEWGVAMRLIDAPVFPRNLTLGAVQDLSLLYALGQEVGRQCRLVGVQMNLAPVVDVNCNPRNPIIHMRSFGENPQQVALRGALFMQGMQSQGVIACAKHFPGHGDVDTDSHVALPIVAHDKSRLYGIELYPFQTLIQAGVQAVMTAHLYVPSYAEETLLPATFSRALVTDLLQKEMGFNGLIISDALNMRALTNTHSPAQIALKALQAGHDLLLYGDHIAPNIDQILRVDVPQAIDAIKTAVIDGEIPEEMIDRKVRKILRAKEQVTQWEPSEGEINTEEVYALRKKLFESAITLVCDNHQLLPLSQQKIALVEAGSSPHFRTLLERALEVDVFSLMDPELPDKLLNYSCVVVSLSGSNVAPYFGWEREELERLSLLVKSEAIAVVFKTPYSLARLPFFETVIVAYENESEAQEAAAKVLLGKLEPKGKLPVNIY